MKIALIADLHLQGKTLSQCNEALRQAKDKITEADCGVIVFLGDVFHKGATVADRYGSTGDLQRVILDFINYFGATAKILFIEGSHDHAGQSKSALEFLRGYSPDVVVFDKPTVFDLFDDISLGILPWVEKSVYYANNCIGMDRTEANAMYTQAIHKSLGIFKDGFKDKQHKILLGHCEVQGSHVNPGYVVQGGLGYSFTSGQLEATGADYIALGHIHKRMGYYVGHLYQDDYGDECNPQGFEILTVDNSGITSEYIELNLPQHYTIEVDNIETLEKLLWNDFDHYKIRFYSQDCYERFTTFPASKYPHIVIEKLWGKTDHVSRTDTELSAQMSETDLLDEYIKINPLPEGVTREELSKHI